MDFEKDIIGKDFAPDGMDEDSGLDDDDMNTDVGDQEGVETDVTSDGGVKKKIITKGSGWEKPEFGDDVEVHYVGTLEDGTKFDSSRDRGEPFRFKVGTGVISGWSEGVKTMKKGEKAVFTMTSSYGYGTMGSPPKIPADATLIFEIELLSWKSVKDISHDGGVIKTIQVEGQGWENPQERDEVLVRYTAKVQGQEAPFAESGDAGAEFTVQDGFLCQAVKVAVKTMKKGEKAHLMVAPEYGFGADGRDGVGADAMLEIDLELVSWKKVQELEGSAVWMKTLVPGGENDYNRPNDGAKCSIRLTGKLQDGTVFEERKEGSELEVVIDNEQLPEGVEKALLKMKKGEIAEVHVEDASFGFGNAASQQQLAEVPAGAKLVYTVELVSFEKAKESWDMDEDEKIAKAKELKEEGNHAYKNAKLARAIRKYDKALKMIQHDDSFDHENKVQTKELKKSFWLNLAAANLRLKDYKQTVQHCTSVLDKDPSCTKALYRRAQAFMGTQDLVEAEVDMKAALSNEPENKELQGLMRQLKQLKRVQNKKEAAMFGRMFAKPLFADVPVTMSTDAPAPDAEAADAGGEEVQPTMVTEAAEEVAAS